MSFRYHGVRIVTAVAGLGALLVSGFPPHSSGQGPPPATDWPAFQKTVQPFLAKYCFECHAEKQLGDVRLNQFDEKALAPRSPTLEKVLERDSFTAQCRWSRPKRRRRVSRSRSSDQSATKCQCPG